MSSIYIETENEIYYQFTWVDGEIEIEKNVYIETIIPRAFFT